MIISNSSTLISLAKIGRLDILNHFGEVYMPNYVYEEAVKKGKEKGLIDAELIDNLFRTKAVKTKDVNKKSWNETKRLLGRELKKGDHSVISLAFQTKAKGILTDDDNLARIAEALGFISKSSADLLLECLKEEKIDWNSYEVSIRSLVLKDRMSQKMAELYMLRGGEVVKRR